MKNRILKISLWFIAGFVLMFLFRLAYSFSEKNTYDEEDGMFSSFGEADMARKNYASDSYKFRKEGYQANEKSGPSKLEISTSQKYEKTATLRAKTEKFEEDEKGLRKEIKAFNAIVQYEGDMGQKGHRGLSLLIGIKPEKFDSFFVALKKVGVNKQADISKVDKTNEYRNLNAKKNSLEKTRESLIQIKKQSGKIEEYVNLENRILEIEQELQELGVQLGDFDEENEFCTIRFALTEVQPPVKMSILHRFKVALEWALTWYFRMAMTVLVIFIASFLLVLIIDKTKLLQAIIKKSGQP
ncbi:MAG: DUF4349 domain-containing protein [Bacteroidia bacterium]